MYSGSKHFLRWQITMKRLHHHVPAMNIFLFDHDHDQNNNPNPINIYYYSCAKHEL